MLIVEVVADGVYGLYLVVASGYTLVDAQVGDVASAAFLEHEFQVLLGMESEYGTVGIDTILHIGSEAVGVIDDRSHAVFLLERMRIEGCLVLADKWVFGGAFGFDDRQRGHVVGEEHIVGIANLGVVGHAWQFDLDAGFASEQCAFLLQHFPARFGEHDVDIEAACLGFGWCVGRWCDYHWLSRGLGELLEVVVFDEHLPILGDGGHHHHVRDE